jgi:cardiolipin synthase
MISVLKKGLRLLSLSVLVYSLSFSQIHAVFAQTDFLYDNSEGSPLLPVIEKAQKSIDIEIYEMENLNVLEALQKAVKRGVKLRVVKDGTPVNAECLVFNEPSDTDDENCQAQKKFVKWVQTNQGVYVPFNKKTLCSPDAKQCFEHGKLLIADQRLALISTGNYNASSFCDMSQNARACNRDYTILTKDPAAVKTLSTVFEHDLRGETYDLKRIVQSPHAERLTISPYARDPLIDAIDSAKSSILIQNQYLFDPNLNESLIRAAKRGVKVFVNVSSVCYFKRPDDFTRDRWTKVFSAFDEAGIQSRMFTQKMTIKNMPGYLHAKMLLVDGTRLWVGSVNGSTQALNFNREFGLFTGEPNAIKKFSHKFSADFKHSLSESWQESLECKHDNPPSTPNPRVAAFQLDLHRNITREGRIGR